MDFFQMVNEVLLETSNNVCNEGWFKKKDKPKEYPVHKSFIQLPDKPPYGFIVLPGGEFIIMNASYEHEEALKTLGLEMDELFMKGGIRMAQHPAMDGYTIDGLVNILKSKKAVKTGRDISAFYDKEAVVEDAARRGFRTPVR